MPEGIVLIVENDPAKVEADLVAGQVTCPACGGVLAPWSFGRRRSLRGEAGAVELRPRRGRCRKCRRTHVLVPDVALARRVDVVAVIGLADVVEAIAVAARAASLRLRPRPAWCWASVLTAGHLLANTNSPWPVP